MDTNKDFEEFLKLLNECGVRYLIVGGYAVGIHASPRYTADIDIFYQRDPKNISAIIKALEQFGFGSLGLAKKDFQVPGQVIQLGQPPNRIDLLNRIDAVGFRRAWRSKIKSHYGPIKVAFLGKVELIKNKRALGRPKDFADLAALETLKTEKRVRKRPRTVLKR